MEFELIKFYLVLYNTFSKSVSISLELVNKFYNTIWKQHLSSFDLAVTIDNSDFRILNVNLWGGLLIAATCY